jgi:predicted porin
MKKYLLLGICGAAIAPAMAQSGVQAYGVVDQFVEYAKTDHVHVTRLTDGGVYASRIGFRGIEDLGGGSHASFQLEAGISSDTGTGNLPGPGLAFTRLSKVGLGGHWGAVEAGRMFTPLFNSVSRGDPFGFNTIYSPLALLGATDGQNGIVKYASRANNMLYYRTPNSLPVMAHVAYSLGEAGSAGHGSGDLWGALLGYTSKSLYLSYALQKTHGGTAAAPLPDPRVSTYQAISASFAATPQLQLYGDLIRSDAGDPAIASARVTVLGASWTTGASEFRAAASHRTVDGSARGQNLWVLGYDYNLSKRTALYTRVLHLQNGGGSAATAADLPIDATGGNGTSLGIGVRHSF